MTRKMKDAFWALGGCVIVTGFLVLALITAASQIHTTREIERVIARAEELNAEIQQDLANLRTEIEDLIAAIREQNKQKSPSYRPNSSFSRPISDFFSFEPAQTSGRRGITHDDIFIRLSELTEMFEAEYDTTDYLLSIVTAVHEEPITPSARFTYMSWQAITNRSSTQWQIQQQAYTGEGGLRFYRGRPLVAIGTGWGGWVGDTIRVRFSSGETLDAIVGDIKSDAHTCPSNITTAHNGCQLEFIVDIPSLCPDARRMGCMARFLGVAGTVEYIDIF